MPLSCGIKTIKYGTIVFNGIVVILGLCMLIIGTWALVGNLTKVGDYDITELVEASTVNALAWVLLVLGIFIFVISFLGCCGAITENSFKLILYAIAIAILGIVLLAIGIYALSSEEDFQQQLKNHLKENIKAYRDPKHTSHKDIVKAYDALQANLKCCGVTSVKDWLEGVRQKDFLNKNFVLVPASCCADDNDECPRLIKLDNYKSFDLHKDGCGDKVIEKLGGTHVIGVAAVVAGVIMILGCAFTFLLIHGIRGRRTGVNPGPVMGPGPVFAPAPVIGAGPAPGQEYY